MQSLSSLAELAHRKFLFEDISIHSITSSVVWLLRMCSGQCPSSLLRINASIHLIGCCKVQRCGLDTLGALSVYEENVDLRKDIFGVLLDYLQSPDSHATVLKKTFQAAVRWIAVCSPFPDLLQFISHDLFPVLEKRMCDLRWEVRDSTLEFITQLTTALNGNSGFTEALHTSGMVSVLLSSLADTEGYVRASAVAAVGEAVTASFHHAATERNSSLLEKALTQMMIALSQDTEGFPRRAVVKAFTSWLKGSHPVTALESSLSSVLSLGGNDFDWEVKMHTLELAEVLMEKTLTCCPYIVQNVDFSEKTRLTQALSRLKDYGLFDLLFNSLLDCDRPVCEKACALLVRLRTLTAETADLDHSALVLNEGYGVIVLNPNENSLEVEKVPDPAKKPSPDASDEPAEKRERKEERENKKKKDFYEKYRNPQKEREMEHIPIRHVDILPTSTPLASFVICFRLSHTLTLSSPQLLVKT
ncbi:hypothetical protein cypCar_00025200 [Cyprinus carpio]|nr:hypothetical protein cypCar_00025200 [Cyprinus carpio]